LSTKLRHANPLCSIFRAKKLNIIARRKRGKDMAKCNCGGMHREHGVGEGDCYRVLVPVSLEPVRVRDRRWEVEGHEITETTLREQRMYSQHEDGRWSKVNGHFSSNSLPDET